MLKDILKLESKNHFIKIDLYFLSISFNLINSIAFYAKSLSYLLMLEYKVLSFTVQVNFSRE